jgi:DNA-binding transcriptional LysR family regulator
MRINFEMLDLRALLAVSEMRSFHRAAESLGLSQPALSRRIKALETSLGTPLLERSTRHVAPTAVARQLEPIMRRLLEELEGSILSLTEVGSKLRGRVSIASIPTAAIYFLPRVIEEFNSKYPNIRFRILDLSSNEGLESIARAEAEFGINILGATHPDLTVTKRSWSRRSLARSVSWSEGVVRFRRPQLDFGTCCSRNGQPLALAEGSGFITSSGRQ